MGRMISTAQVQVNPGISDTKVSFGMGNYRIFSTSCNWTVPQGVGAVRVTLLGAGGGAGGHWAPTTDLKSLWDCIPTKKSVLSVGAPGGGGAYGVGIAQVTPGCQCCIVVGAGGTGSSWVCTYWIDALCTTYLNNCMNCSVSCNYNLPGSTCQCNIMSLCCITSPVPCLCCCIRAMNYTGVTSAVSGACGGFSCAFGMCAQGGGGGQGGCCLCLSLCCWQNCVGINTAAYYDTSMRCGGIGGCSFGTSISYCGANGSDVCAAQGLCYYVGCSYCYSCACYRSLDNIYGGASGSPLGNAEGSCIPQPFSGNGFDGSCCGEEYLRVLYDLPPPRWCGQIIYTQYGNFTVGSNNFKCCYSYCSGQCCCTSGTRSKWVAARGTCQCCYFACNATTPANTQSYNRTDQSGCGAGGIPASLTAAYYPGTGSCSSTCWCIATMGSGYNGGNGEVIVEW